jgi:hypothetical protein
MFTSSARSLARWIVALPLVLVGSLLYWSLALGLGGVSLMRFCALSQGGGAEARLDFASPFDGERRDEATVAGPIMVHLEESAEPEDVNDNAGAGGFVAPDDNRSAAVQGPGSTSY